MGAGGVTTWGGFGVFLIAMLFRRLIVPWGPGREGLATPVGMGPGWVAPGCARGHEAGGGNRSGRTRTADTRGKPGVAIQPARGGGVGGRPRGMGWGVWMALVFTAVSGGASDETGADKGGTGLLAGDAGGRVDWRGRGPGGPLVGWGQAGGCGAEPGRRREWGNWTSDGGTGGVWGRRLAGEAPARKGRVEGMASGVGAPRQALSTVGGGGKRRRGDGGEEGGGEGVGAEVRGGEDRGRTVLRRGFAEHFLVYSANVGGLHMTGRSEGAARGGNIRGAFSQSFLPGSKWERLEAVMTQNNVDEFQTKRHALLVLSETQTRSSEVATTRVQMVQWGYQVVVSRGVRGMQREERGGVIVAWDAKTLTALPLTRKGRLHRVVVRGRVVQMRFRVRAGDGERWGGQGRHDGLDERGPQGDRHGYDLDLLACYMPQRRGNRKALAEAGKAWTTLTEKVARLAGAGRLMIIGDLNAELKTEMQRRGVVPTASDEHLDSWVQGASVRRVGGEGDEAWTHVYRLGTDDEVRTIIDHIFVGSVWGARVARVEVQEGVEACSTGGHCHRAVVATVTRGGHPPLPDAEWRPEAGVLCDPREDEGETRNCMATYRAELAGQYRGQLARERGLNERRGLGGDVGGARGDGEGDGTQCGVRVCVLTAVKGSPQRCPGGCDEPGAETECVRVGGQGVLGQVFEAVGEPAEGFGPQWGAAAREEAELQRRLLDALEATNGGTGTAEDGEGVGLLETTPAQSAVGGWAVKDRYRDRRSELLRWGALMLLSDRLRRGGVVTLAVDRPAGSAYAELLAGWMDGWIRRTGGYAAGGPGEGASGVEEWAALEEGIGPGRLVMAQQRAMAAAMALATSSVGKAGGGKGRAGGDGRARSVVDHGRLGRGGWVQSVRQRLAAIQDAPVDAAGWRAFLPQRRDLVRGVPQAYQGGGWKLD